MSASLHPVGVEGRMSDETRYEERYCAFVDILGFRQLIQRLEHGQVQFTFIRDLLRQIYSPQVSGCVDLDEMQFRAQSISDGLAISIPVSLSGLVVLFEAIRNLSVALLEQGYFVRGAICRGKLYHDERMVFGEALVKAYTLESEIARYPRVMVTKDVVYD